MKPGILSAAAALLLLSGCSRSNNLLLGRLEATVGSHKVVVTDCYRLSVPPPETAGAREYHYAPCRDADVWIRGDRLTVNGRDYGTIANDAAVVVDHGIVQVRKAG